jgi:hypothetical protein
MSHKLFFVSDTNPNDTTGGGGCICSPVKQIDCKAPFVIFPGNDMEDVGSPNVVVCQACLVAGVEACDGEVLSAGEKNDQVKYDESLPDPVRERGVNYDDEEIPEV